LEETCSDKQREENEARTAELEIIEERLDVH
jgi:hypothetical protein